MQPGGIDDGSSHVHTETKHECTHTHTHTHTHDPICAKDLLCQRHRPRVLIRVLVCALKSSAPGAYVLETSSTPHEMLARPMACLCPRMHVYMFAPLLLCPGRTSRLTLGVSMTS